MSVLPPAQPGMGFMRELSFLDAAGSWPDRHRLVAGTRTRRHGQYSCRFPDDVGQIIRQASRYSGPVPSASRWLAIATPGTGTGPGAARWSAS